MAKAPQSNPVRVGILVFDGVKLLDIAGPAEAFAEANLLGAAYELVFLSPEGNDVVSSVGMRVAVDAAAAGATDFHTILVAGGDTLARSPVPSDLLTATSYLAGSTERMASICTGAFVLAAAGLLDGRRATTHWKHTKELARRYPTTQVEPDAIFVSDGRIHTSAGVTAGIDLALALIEDDHGPELARAVAAPWWCTCKGPAVNPNFLPRCKEIRPGRRRCARCSTPYGPTQQRFTPFRFLPTTPT